MAEIGSDAVGYVYQGGRDFQSRCYPPLFDMGAGVEMGLQQLLLVFVFPARQDNIKARGG